MGNIPTKQFFNGAFTMVILYWLYEIYARYGKNIQAPIISISGTDSNVSV